MKGRKVLLIACLLLLAGLALAQENAGSTTGGASGGGTTAPCAEGKYECGKEVLEICLNGAWQRYAVGTDSYVKYCGAQTSPTPTPGNTCEEDCKRAYSGDEYQARLCLQVKCENQAVSCKDQCYLEYGREGYAKCYVDRCEKQTTPPQPNPPQTCEERCKIKASADVTTTAATNTAATMNADVFRQCMREECGAAEPQPTPKPEPIDTSCEGTCKRQYADNQDKIERCFEACRGQYKEPPATGNCQDGAVKVLVCKAGNWQPVFEQQPYCGGYVVPAQAQAVRETARPMMPTAVARQVAMEKPSTAPNAVSCRDGEFRCFPEKKAVMVCENGNPRAYTEASAFDKFCGQRNVVQALVSVFTGEKECQEGQFRCYDDAQKVEWCDNGRWHADAGDAFAKYCGKSQ